MGACAPRVDRRLGPEPRAVTGTGKERTRMGRIGQSLTAVGLGLALLAIAPSWAAAIDFEHVHALAMDADGRALFLGAHTGLYRSEDGGRSWQPVALPGSSGHGHLDLMAIAPDRRDPRTLY